MMTDNEFILYYLIVVFAGIVVFFCLHDYPIAEAINGTHAMMTGAI